MVITDIIGKGKDFEPPFRRYGTTIIDPHGYELANCNTIFRARYPNDSVDDASDKTNAIIDHICEMLNQQCQHSEFVDGLMAFLKEKSKLQDKYPRDMSWDAFYRYGFSNAMYQVMDWIDKYNQHG